MSVFLDTNVVVYLVERTPHLGTAATKRVQDFISQGQRLVVSDLVRMECRVRPLRLNDAITLAAFNGYFDSEDVDVAPITAAVEKGCERFLTHDARLRSFSDISVEVLG